MDRINDNAFCSEEHDDYVRATLYCCSCEKYYCPECDVSQHAPKEGQDLMMHIRVPTNNASHDDDEDYTENTKTIVEGGQRLSIPALIASPFKKSEMDRERDRVKKEIAEQQEKTRKESAEQQEKARKENAEQQERAKKVTLQQPAPKVEKSDMEGDQGASGEVTPAKMSIGASILNTLKKATDSNKEKEKEKLDVEGDQVVVVEGEVAPAKMSIGASILNTLKKATDNNKEKEGEKKEGEKKEDSPQPQKKSLAESFRSTFKSKAKKEAEQKEADEKKLKEEEDQIVVGDDEEDAFGDSNNNLIDVSDLSKAAPTTIVPTTEDDAYDKQQQQKQQEPLSTSTDTLKEGKVEKEVTFNNINESFTNSCALQPGEEDAYDSEYHLDGIDDTVEAQNVVKGMFEGFYKLGHGVAHGVSGIVSDPIKGAKEGGVKGFFKGVGKGISGAALKPVKGSADLFIKTSEGLRNTPESIFTPSHQHIDVLKEKEATHLLDGLYQGTLGLGKGIFDGVTGIISEPIKGAQENGGAGFMVGLGKGLLGAVCKPLSGAMDFVSKPIEGLANTPKTIIDHIDEKKRVKKLQQDKKDAALKASTDSSSTEVEHEAISPDLYETPTQSSSSSPTLSPSSLRPVNSKAADDAQKEYNKKWLEKNKIIGKHSISSNEFKAKDSL
eukprot:gene8353-9805_t